MKNNRTWVAAFSAFLLVLVVFLCIGGFLVVSVRSGRTLFGATYEPITWQGGTLAGTTLPVWIPARLRAVLYVPRVELYGFERLLERWVLP